MKITNRLKIGVFIFAATVSQSHAAGLVPIAATGWNQDIVIGSGEGLAGRTATMDEGIGGGANTWYGVGNNVLAPSTGLPVGPTNSLATGSDFTFQLQPFNANNALLNGGTLTLSSPTSMLRLGLIGSTAVGTSDITVTVNYASGAPDVFTSAGAINLDWALNSPADTAYISQGRLNVSTGTYSLVNNPNFMSIFQSVYTLTNTSNVVSIGIVKNGPGNNAIMAISGEVIPEPSAVVLVGISALGLFARRRR